MRSPDSASTECGGGHLIAAHYSFIDPERMKGWVVYDTSFCTSLFTQINVATKHEMNEQPSHNVNIIAFRPDLHNVTPNNIVIESVSNCMQRIFTKMTQKERERRQLQIEDILAIIT